MSEIQKIIYLIRNHRVMLDEDLAKLYDVPTMRLNEQVKRNKERFPPSFMFQLTQQEYDQLISHLPSPRTGRGGRRKLPYVFTEHGTLMLANVLKSKSAIQASVQIVETFIKLREMVATQSQLTRKINSMEKKYDHQFKVVFDAIRQLMEPPKKKLRKIGFGRD